MATQNSHAGSIHELILLHAKFYDTLLIMIDIQTLVLILLVTLNGVTFCMFGADKWLAHGHSWRISEKTLWCLALIGGSPGALLGMHLFRHKTKKTSFQLIMILIIMVQLMAAFVVYSYFKPDILAEYL